MRERVRATQPGSFTRLQTAKDFDSRRKRAVVS